MRILFWLLLGCVLVSVAFFLWQDQTDLWTSVIASGIAAALFLLILLAVENRPPISFRTRVLIVLIAAMAVALSAYSIHITKNESEWRRGEFHSIRNAIGRGINLSMVGDSLLWVLETAHRGGAAERRNLKNAFAKCFPRTYMGGNMYQWMQQPGDTNFAWIVESITADSVVVAAIDQVARGKNAGFINANGLRGFLQQRFVLTLEGLRYVTEN